MLLNPPLRQAAERYATFMNDETKNNWRDRWLNSINELSSIGLQQISWTNISLDNPHYTFIEFMSCYFDDLVLSEDYSKELKQNYVSLKEYKTIEDWHKKLIAYKTPQNDDFDNYAILVDPNWIEIVELGRQSKFMLAEILSTAEKEILMKV